MPTEALPQLLPTDRLRAQFPGLSPEVAALDGAGGTQAPQAVIDAVAEGLVTAMSNVGGAFPVSDVSGQVVAEARSAIADLVGGVPEGVVLGPSMTTLTFRIADTLSRDWGPGDEVVVTSLDHDANIRPWRLAAERAGATVRVAEFDVETGELPVESVDSVLSDRTRLVAVTAASNAIGTRPGRARDLRCDPRRRRAHVRGWRALDPACADRRGRAGGRLLRVLVLQVLRAAHGCGHR